jgi:hypothetical protein
MFRIFAFLFVGLFAMTVDSDVFAGETSARSALACFGRFLINVPDGARVLGVSSDYLFGFLDKDGVALDKHGFEQFLVKREGFYKGRDRKKDRILLRSYTPHPNTKIITTVEEVFGRDSYGFEAYALRGGSLFSIKKKGYEADIFGREVLPELEVMLSNLRVRQSDEIPVEPGVCIEDGFVASNGSENALERAKLFLDFKKWPELSLTVESWTVTKPEPSLLTRLNNVAVPEAFLSLMGQMKTLRRGKHDVGRFKGEESLDMVPTGGGYKVHMFRWEAQGVPDDPFRPNLVVELTTGRNSGYQGKRPTISEQEAVELFDAVVNSIRLRPTGPAKRSEAAPAPKAPLGEMATTGRQCPQTGCWRAEEGEERLIREGEVMPHTPVSGTASLWQKLRGEAAPIYRSATVWKLVAYEMPADDTPPDGQGSTG